MANRTVERVLADLQLAKQGSYDTSAMDVLDHVLFDNQDFQATTARPSTSFFQQPVNSPYMGGAKTVAETNMELQGQLPNSQYFIASEMSFAFLGQGGAPDTMVTAYARILRSSNIKLILAGRSYDLEVPGSVFLPPVFEIGVNSAANAQRAGEHTISGWMSFKLPIVIEGGAAFAVKMTTGAASSTIQAALNTASNTLYTQNAQIQCRLKGTLIRYK